MSLFSRFRATGAIFRPVRTSEFSLSSSDSLPLALTKATEIATTTRNIVAQRRFMTHLLIIVCGVRFPAGGVRPGSSPAMWQSRQNLLVDVADVDAALLDRLSAQRSKIGRRIRKADQDVGPGFVLSVKWSRVIHVETA